MPDYVVTGPDGRQLRFTGPEAPSQAMIEQGFQKLPDPQQAWQKAQGIGPARVGERYLPTGGPMGILDVIRTALGGAQRPASVAAQDPYGIQAWEKGAGPMPTPIMAETQAVGPGITAYHGSPYDFEKFDLGKIGTGEGAQAYGHGLYFAENPKVAEGYKAALGQQLQVGEQKIPLNRPGGWTPENTAANALLLANNDLDNAIIDTADRLRAAEARGTERLAPQLKEGLRVLNEWKEKGLIPQQVSGGKTYQVSIAAHPDQFLDWDKPLSQQTPEVQDALGRLGIAPKPVVKWEPHQITKQDIDAKLVPSSYAPGSWISVQKDPTGRVEWHGGQLFGSQGEAASNAAMRSAIDQRAVRDKGSELYRDLGAPTSPEASAKLKSVGVQGIKYLDQGSRAAGEGSRNFVVFDDSLISIMKKYGIALPFFAGMSRLAQRQQAQGQP